MVSSVVCAGTVLEVCERLAAEPQACTPYVGGGFFGYTRGPEGEQFLVDSHDGRFRVFQAVDQRFRRQIGEGVCAVNPGEDVRGLEAFVESQPLPRAGLYRHEDVVLVVGQPECLVQSLAYVRPGATAPAWTLDDPLDPAAWWQHRPEPVLPVDAAANEARGDWWFGQHPEGRPHDLIVLQYEGFEVFTATPGLRGIGPVELCDMIHDGLLRDLALDERWQPGRLRLRFPT